MKNKSRFLGNRKLFVTVTFLLLSNASLNLTFAATPNTTSTKPTITNAPAEIRLQSSIDLVNRANDIYNHGQYAKALILYQKAQVRGGDLGIIAFNIGNCYFRLNQLAPAAAAFQKSVRLTDGKYTPALFNLAAVLFRLEQYGECIAAYRRALNEEPENSSAWLYLADAYSRIKDFVGAQQALEKARNLEPEDVSIVYQLAEVHASLKEYSVAIDLIREAYARKPNEIDFLFYIGDLYRTQGQLEQAAAAYREGLSLREKDYESMYKLADVLALDKKPFLAMEYLQKALLVKSDYSDAAVFLGNLAFDAKWWDRCQAAYEKALLLKNNEGLEGLRNLAYEFHQQGNNERAASILLAAQKLRPKDKALKQEVDQYQALAEENRENKTNKP